VEVHIDPGVPIALGVPTYVELACGNLLGNADKYSPPDAAIEVVVSSDAKGRPQVLVLDSGPGIEADEVHELFKPFYRSRRTSGNVKGIGVGLSVSKRVIEAQGGRIWARPRDEGGAEFGFSLRPASTEVAPTS
jgi:K+-sensing histidine kinase KdpD